MGESGQDSLHALRFEFSESMDHRSVQTGVVVSPSPGPLQWRWEGRTGSALLTQPLAPATTYSVLIMPTLADAKGNRIGAASAVRFSTGAALDSGRVSGTVSGQRTRGGGVYIVLRRDDRLRSAAEAVVRAQEGRNAEDVLAGASLAELGEHVALADAQGAFTVEGLPDGRYTVAAFADRNNNRAFDPDRDVLGVACERVEVRAGSPPPAVRLSVGDIDERPQVAGSVTDSVRVLALARGDTAAADSLHRLAIWVMVAGDSGRVVRADSAGVFRASDLAPGAYRLRAFRDVDGDSTWAAGREPASDSLEICAGWGADFSGLRLVLRAPPPPPVAPAPPLPAPPAERKRRPR